MFENLRKLNRNCRNALFDENGSVYDGILPIGTAVVKTYGRPYAKETILSVSAYRELEEQLFIKYPSANAWHSIGIIGNGSDLLECADMNLDGSIIVEEREIQYNLKQIDLYHLP